jgi:ribosomal protein L33
MCDTSGMLALRGRQTHVSAQGMQEKVQLVCSDEAVRERTSEDNDKNACKKLAEMEKKRGENKRSNKSRRPSFE